MICSNRRWLPSAALLCFLPLGLFPARAAATTTPRHHPQHSQSTHRTATPAHPMPTAAAASSARPTTPTVPTRPNDMPPRPATITLRNGRLTVSADNSDLREILMSIAGKAGMKISGLDTTSRVFGTYGPGQPRDVLTDLLSGSGYNFMMMGQTASGAPLELLLTAQTGGPFTPSPQPDNSAGPPPWEQLRSPGAVMHVPPDEFRNMTPQERVQQHIEQLRHMREPFQQPQQQ